MSACEIVNLVENIKDKKALFLIQALSDCAGFFAHDGRLLYVAKDIFDYSYEGVETDYLRLETHIYISSVENDQTFENDNYNIITFKGELADENIVSFIKLCRVHACNMREIRFREFFYSLISLFQISGEQSFKNAVGLYGELKFMQMVVDVFGHDISNSWHKKGTTSQYDFFNGQKSIEVKATTSEQMSVLIKHQQIFGENPCWLVVVICEECEIGETVEELSDKLIEMEKSFMNFNFSINLEKELKRISSEAAKELRLKLREVKVFDTETINPFVSIPDSVDKLEYRLTVSELNTLTNYDIAQLIYEF